MIEWNSYEEIILWMENLCQRKWNDTKIAVITPPLVYVLLFHVKIMYYDTCKKYPFSNRIITKKHKWILYKEFHFSETT